jgi:hypothetical protein
LVRHQLNLKGVAPVDRQLDAGPQIHADCREATESLIQIKRVWVPGALLASTCDMAGHEFGLGAAVGTMAIKGMPWLALGIPVTALLIVLLCCGTERNIGQRTDG